MSRAKRWVFLLSLLVVSSLFWGCSQDQIVTPLVSTSTPMPTSKPTPAKYPSSGDYIENIEVDGASRWFAVHIPTGYQPGEPMPLVINLHGRTADAMQQAEMTQMNAKADQAGFIVVHPQASDHPPTWWGVIPGEIGEPDMRFFEQMLKTLRHDINIDPARIYATGFSNGASMANRLACAYADTFAAIAPVSGGHVGYSDCEADQPVSVLVFHGINDTVIPFHGNDNNPLVHDWVEAWAERNRCDPTSVEDDAYTNVKRETWTHCEQDTVVIFYAIEEAGHTWPGSDFGEHFGGTTRAINATDEIWEFFVQHPKSKIP